MIYGFMHIIYGCIAKSRWLRTHCVVYRSGLFVFKFEINFYIGYTMLNNWFFYTETFNVEPNKTLSAITVLMNPSSVHHYYRKIWFLLTPISNSKHINTTVEWHLCVEIFLQFCLLVWTNYTVSEKSQKCKIDKY